MKARIAAFFLGMWEFRRAFTTRHKTFALRDAYDSGRGLAHTLTFNHFDD